MRFGEYLTHAVSKAGLSQAGFAKKVGQHQQTVNAIARGTRKPSLKNIQKWADVLAKVINRQEFLELARLENSPPEIRELVSNLKAQVKAFTKDR